MAGIPIVQRVDAIEARGDVGGALRVIEADLSRRQDVDDFWSPDRVRHLMQLAVYRTVLPPWVYSRWILEQAVRWMDESQRGRMKRAFERTVRVIGGLERYSGVDEGDSSCRLMDHDWVYRQLMLYEYGGLEHFLDKIAGSTLIAQADRVRGWARTPMGGYRLERQAARTLTWCDLGTGQQVETVNIGTALLVETGEHVIGRLVPTRTGPMFEAAPLVVPRDVAVEVAATPSDWTSAVERRCAGATSEETIWTRVAEFPLLSDVPLSLQHLIALRVVQARADDRQTEAGDVDDGAGAVGGEAVLAAALLDQLDTDGFPEPWPIVGAVLLEPWLFADLMGGLGPGDAAGFQRLAARLAGPAAEVCRLLAGERAGSARRSAKAG